MITLLLYITAYIIAIFIALFILWVIHKSCAFAIKKLDPLLESIPTTIHRYAIQPISLAIFTGLSVNYYNNSLNSSSNLTRQQAALMLIIITIMLIVWLTSCFTTYAFDETPTAILQRIITRTHKKCLTKHEYKDSDKILVLSKRILESTGKISVNKLQCLVFLCQEYSLGWDNVPLFADTVFTNSGYPSYKSIEALFSDECTSLGTRPIDESMIDNSKLGYSFSWDELSTINSVLKQYSSWTAKQLQQDIKKTQKQTKINTGDIELSIEQAQKHLYNSAETTSCKF